MTRPLVIWGAGAIGGTIGAYLIRAGHDVLFVDQAQDHVTAMNENGLTIEGPIEEFTVPARAVTPETLTGTYPAIWLCTKAQHTEGAARALAPHLAQGGHVLSLQNGLNELTIADIVGRDATVGAFINFGADYLGPGRILFGGRAAVVVGELDGADPPRLTETHRLLSIFEPNAITTPAIWGYLWGKLGYGALLFATALTDDSIADVLDHRAYRPALAALACELTAVADAQGVTPQGFNGYDPAAFRADADPAATEASFDAMVAHNRTSAKSHSGIWRDLAVRKRRTEVDPQLTKPIEVGAALGLPMPLTRRLVTLIQGIEEGRRPLSFETLDALTAEHLAGATK
ncbi:MAG: ketopantoate reductase family protein [Proteobacteria bacterium]|nr:ketopantoate reductase family protein [Pseudomonadota bacterium]